MIWLNKSKSKYVTKCKMSISGYDIPEGFEFDGMSAPWVLRSFVGGPYRPATVEAVLLHDYLYKKKFMTRKKTDKLFYRMLKQEGVNCAWLFYIAVRLFGWSHYK